MKSVQRKPVDNRMYASLSPAEKSIDHQFIISKPNQYNSKKKNRVIPIFPKG